MTAESRVQWLLRTWYDVREGYGRDSTGQGVRMMPSDWARHSYPELERRLIDMRDDGHRREWWHATRRYRDTERVVLDVPVFRSTRGPVPLLPAHCELAGGAVWTGDKRARVIVRRWPATVNLSMAEAGVAHLVKVMYGGDVQRIVLPPAVMAVVVP